MFSWFSLYSQLVKKKILDTKHFNKKHNMNQKS